MTRVLAIEPFFGGSHRSFLANLTSHSRLTWTLITQPARHWKWRMRSSPLAIRDEVRAKATEADLLFVSDYVDLAALRGLCPEIAHLPTIIYFHENQITYPHRTQHTGDGHFAFTHFTSLACADAVWFNSAWHLRDFTAGMTDLTRRYPESGAGVREVKWREKARVVYPGISETMRCKADQHGAPIIVWNHRWEYDKDPEAFFTALIELAGQFDFQLVVLGESYNKHPAIFDTARAMLANRILHWGFVEDYESYCAWLNQSDLLVSTARHEFFGISTMEAVRAGCRPILPNSLSYPELFPAEYLYEPGTLQQTLANALQMAVHAGQKETYQDLAHSFLWPERAAEFDTLLEGFC